MIYHRIIAIIDLLFVGFVMRVVLGELKVLSEISPILFVMFFALISVLMLVVMFIKKEEKTVTYKGK